MLVPLSALLTFLSAVLITSGLRARSVNIVDERLKAVKAGIRPSISSLDDPFVERAIAPVMAALVNTILKLLPPSWIKATSKRLVLAGSPIAFSGFLIIWASMAVGFCVLALLFADSASLSPVLRIILAGVGFLIGGVLPQLWLRMRINDRKYKARKQLPDALDLMTSSVEAGLSLDAALRRLVEYQSGPLREEVSRAIVDMTLGKSRREALTEAAERLPLPEFAAFVQSLSQAEVSGAPIGEVLRVQAEQIRIKRRQHAEAQAQRAPLLMILPLVFLILPSMFVVLLAPAALTIIQAFSDSEVFGK